MPNIKIKNIIPRFDEFRFNGIIDIEIADGHNVAIIGRNGAGKSLFVDLMTSNIALREGEISITTNGITVPRTKIKYMSFRDIYQMANNTENYYQQRWNATENDESPIVGEIIGHEKCQKNADLIKLLHIEDVIEKRLIFLSSGELRKMQIFRALLSQPLLLIIDNPYIGLDEESRGIVNNLFETLSRERGLQIILILSNPRDIPDIVDVVLPIENRTCFSIVSRADFLNDSELCSHLFPKEINDLSALNNVTINDETNYENALIMNKVSVRYFQKQILKDVDWRVRRGEKWALLGKNGCGKSTLLSLVCGDNPQAYVNDIVLFDRQRGTGESIWEIKKHIGYLSPDMHTYYQKDIPCVDVVASGLFDTIGLYRVINDNQRERAIKWMKIFGIEDLASRSFVKISYGEQRIVLLTRVFVKQPSLLILDEPLHGLDAGRKTLAKAVIEKYCENSDVTLIYVTHYTHEIPECVDKRFIMKSLK